MSPELMMSLSLLIPVLAALVIPLAGRWPNLRETVTLLAGAGLLATVAALAPTVLAGEQPGFALIEPVPGLAIALSAEPLGLLFALVAGTLWPITSVYAIGYMRAHHEHNQTRFYAAFALALASTMGMAFSANMFTLFLFYELLTLSTYPLVTHSGDAQARRAGRVYLGILMSTSIALLLLAMIWTWQVAGTLTFAEGGVLGGHASHWALGAMLALYVLGVGKAALMPFHRWLPAAMVAPTPVSALLHAVAVVKAGVFTILKVAIYLFGLDTLATIGADETLAYLAGFTIIAASIVALRKDNLKARLAYSTISQLGYVVLGAVLATRLAWEGAALHIAMHAVGKITLFFCAGAILVAAHKSEISQMKGLGRRMPVTMTAFFIASLSIIGLPPGGGLWSKWLLAVGAWEAGALVFVAVLMVSSLLNIAYLLPIPAYGFFAKADDGEPAGMHEAPLACLIPIVITALGCVALFVYPQPLYELLALLPGGRG